MGRGNWQNQNVYRNKRSLVWFKQKIFSKVTKISVLYCLSTNNIKSIIIKYMLIAYLIFYLSLNAA